MKARSGRTTTSAFGAGRRESHDARDFYARFEEPELSIDDTIEPLTDLIQGVAACVCGDARRLVTPDGAPLPDNSVALVVTSPPYFSGKEYEQALGEGIIPGTYLEYLEMLRDVFAECKRVLEPGGRIAVNVANLGRKPYRSLSADIIRILQDDLRLLLRGEVIWRKAEGASGSCAWGSFRRATNPVLRDVTERVVVASKGRLDRAKSAEARRKLGLPSVSEIASDEFMEATLDVWNIPPESARRVHHPAPFPVELPQRLIRLYTYRGDVVLDPFMGSGTTLVAAARTGRRYLGYDTDADYVATARHRLAEELAGLPGSCAGIATGVRSPAPSPVGPGPSPIGPAPSPVGPAPAARRSSRAPRSAPDDFHARAAAEGKAVRAIAEDALRDAGFVITHRGARQRGLGLTVDLIARDVVGESWYFDVSGAFTTTRGGLLRSDEVWKALGRATVLAAHGRSPLVLLTSHLPRRRSEGDSALRSVGPKILFDAIEILADDQRPRLAIYAGGGRTDRPEAGFWTPGDLAVR